MTALPTTASKQIINSLLNSLRNIETSHRPTTSAKQPGIPVISTLKTLDPSDKERTKSVLLTLHFLFPHELLPALDLIDRHLITRLIFRKATGLSEADATDAAPQKGQHQLEHKGSIDDSTVDREVFYVQSASALTSDSRGKGRFRNALSTARQFYEVRLDGWNCNCPAFALSSLRFLMRDIQTNLDTATASMQKGQAGLQIEQILFGAEDRNAEWLYGGTATKDHAAIPICKHTLAVVLIKAAPALFLGALTDREVNEEETAGWAAGWGEH